MNHANAEILERVVLVERNRLLFWRFLRVGKRKDQRPGGIVMHMSLLLFVVAMDMTVEDGYVFIW